MFPIKQYVNNYFSEVDGSVHFSLLICRKFIKFEVYFCIKLEKSARKIIPGMFRIFKLIFGSIITLLNAGQGVPSMTFLIYGQSDLFHCYQLIHFIFVLIVCAFLSKKEI